MQFLIYLYLILTLKISIQAERLSLSVLNIIPNIISNGRFIQEHFIDSTLEFNQTQTWMNLDLKFNANASNCSQDLDLLVRDLNNKQKWAIKSKFSEKENFSFNVFYFSIRCMGEIAQRNNARKYLLDRFIKRMSTSLTRFKQYHH